MKINPTGNPQFSEMVNFRETSPYDLDLNISFRQVNSDSLNNEMPTASVTCRGSCDHTNCGTITCIGTCDCLGGAPGMLTFGCA
jgi:hypothetical protein